MAENPLIKEALTYFDRLCDGKHDKRVCHGHALAAEVARLMNQLRDSRAEVARMEAWLAEADALRKPE